MTKLYTEYKKIWHCKNDSGNTKKISRIVQNILKKRKVKFFLDDTGNVFIGEFEKKVPCLIAHLDSIHLKKPKKIKLKNGILSSSSGIGGDDKCGIIAILEILKNPVCTAILTVDEETGGIGASSIDKKTLKNCTCFIEIDRRGNGDCITTIGYENICSKKFKQAINTVLTKNNFKFESGLFTDIVYLREKRAISSINLSAGYYNPHTSQEYVNLSDLNKTIQTIKAILNIIQDTEFLFPLQEKFDYFNSYQYEYNYNKKNRTI